MSCNPRARAEAFRETPRNRLCRAAGVAPGRGLAQRREAPRSLEIAREAGPVLDGRAIGAENQSLAGAQVLVYAVDPATGRRLGEPVHRKTVGADGRWGPFNARADAAYEFVLDTQAGVTHIYRSPFPRGSSLVNPVSYTHLTLPTSDLV